MNICLCNGSTCARRMSVFYIILWTWIHHHVKDSFQMKLEQAFPCPQ